jgi:hypothetical protein
MEQAVSCSQFSVVKKSEDINSLSVKDVVESGNQSLLCNWPDLSPVSFEVFVSRRVVAGVSLGEVDSNRCPRAL